jgi:hypothetical protein
MGADRVAAARFFLGQDYGVPSWSLGLRESGLAARISPAPMIIARLVMVESGFDGELSTPLEGQQAAQPSDVAL